MEGNTCHRDNWLISFNKVNVIRMVLKTGNVPDYGRLRDLTTKCNTESWVGSFLEKKIATTNAKKNAWVNWWNWNMDYRLKYYINFAFLKFDVFIDIKQFIQEICSLLWNCGRMLEKDKWVLVRICHSTHSYNSYSLSISLKLFQNKKSLKNKRSDLLKSLYRAESKGCSWVRGKPVAQTQEDLSIFFKDQEERGLGGGRG